MECTAFGGMPPDSAPKRRDHPLRIRTHLARATVAVALGATVLTGLPTLAVADTSEQLQAKLDEANAHLSDLYSQAEQVSEQVNQTQVDLDNTNAEIEQKQSELSEAQETLGKRVSSNYKTGGVSLASILFDSTSFEDLVNRVTYASKVSDSDAQIIQQVKDIQNELNEKQSQQQQLLADQQTKARANLDMTGVLSDDARKALRATIDLMHGCKGAKGSENETVLVCGDDVVNKTLPTILCDEDDVEGTHGAAIGSVSPEQLAYLADRGLTAKEAEALIRRAIVDDAANTLPGHAPAAVISWARETLGAETAAEIADALELGQDAIDEGTTPEEA